MQQMPGRDAYLDGLLANTITRYEGRGQQLRAVRMCKKAFDMY